MTPEDMSLEQYAELYGAQPPDPRNRMEQLAMDGHYTLTPEAVASFLGIHPQKLRELARKEDTRAALGFPVIVAGRTTLIPKVPFLRFMGYEGEVVLA